MRENSHRENSGETWYFVGLMCVIKQGSNKNDYGSFLEYNVIPIYWQKFVVGVTCLGLGLSPRCWYFPLNDICWPNLLSCVWPRVCHIGCLVRGGGGEGRPSQYCDTLRRLSSGDGWVRCVTCHRHRIQIYIVLLLAVTGAQWVLFSIFPESPSSLSLSQTLKG